MAGDSAGAGVGLLPCPHCQQGPHVDTRDPMATDGVTHWVVCRKCGACGPVSHAQGGAVDYWNRRPPAPASAREAIAQFADTLANDAHARMGDFSLSDFEGGEARIERDAYSRLAGLIRSGAALAAPAPRPVAAAGEVERSREVGDQLAAAKREAESLASALCRRHYSDVFPRFTLCDTVAGVISQIDNMTAGMSSELDRLRAARAALTAARDATEGDDGRADAGGGVSKCLAVAYPEHYDCAGPDCDCCADTSDATAPADARAGEDVVPAIGSRVRCRVEGDFGTVIRHEVIVELDDHRAILTAAPDDLEVLAITTPEAAPGDATPDAATDGEGRS